MKTIIIIIALIIIVKSQTITASLKLVQYEPSYVFWLEFSEPVQKPTFQLLRNHLSQINYTFLTTQSPNQIYIIQAEHQTLSSTEYLENYQIIFNSPLKIGSGRLGVSYFMLKSAKGSIRTDFIETFGIIAVVLAYIFVLFTDLGQKLLEFLRMYCLIMFIDRSKSNLYVSLSKYLLMIDPHDMTSQRFNNQFLIYYMVPIFCVTAAALLGFILKRSVCQRKSIMGKIFYEKFVYDTFVVTSLIFLTPIFFNSISFFHIMYKHPLSNEPGIVTFCYISSIYGIILVPTIIYLFAYQINPKLNQTQQSWNKYLQSQRFNNFKKLHEHIHLKPWYKRNQLIFLLSFKIIRLVFFFLEESFIQIVFFIEFFELLYIFTIRPFKNELYINIMVILRLSLIAFFGLVIIGSLYFSLGDITITYTSASKYILARDIIFLLIVLEFLVFIAYELVVKCSNFNYHVRLIREENEFKLKITQKNQSETENQSRGYKQTIDSSDNSYTRGRVQSSATNVQSVKKRTNYSQLNTSQVHVTSRFSGSKQIIRQNNVEKQLKQYLQGTHKPKRSRTKVQVEMMDMSTKNKMMKDVEEKLTSGSLNGKKKWKKQSLLVEISKDK